MSRQEFDLFERADALGVSVVGDDYEKLLDAIHEREMELMDLRHAVQRRLAFNDAEHERNHP